MENKIETLCKQMKWMLKVELSVQGYMQNSRSAEN